MKRILCSILTLVILGSTLVSCVAPIMDGNATPTGAYGVIDEDKNDNNLVGVVNGGVVYYDDGQYLTQPEGKDLYMNGGNMEANTSFAINAADYFPDIKDIVEQGRADTTVYGIYNFIENYRQYYEQIEDIGFSNMRLTLDRICNHSLDSSIIGYMPYSDEFKEIVMEDGVSYYFNDEHIRILAVNGIDYFVTAGQGNAASRYFQPGADKIRRDLLTYEDIRVDEWISNLTRQVLEFFRRYGHNGTFWQENPDVPYYPATAFEPYNEPNFIYLIGPAYFDANGNGVIDKGTEDQKKYSPSQALLERLYAEYQIAVYTAVKAEFPDVKIIGFGAGGAMDADRSYITNVLNKYPESVNTMDVLSTHPYFEDISPFAAATNAAALAERLRNFRNLLDNKGKEDMPIWYTECGWQIPKTQGGNFYYSGGIAGADQLTQAAMLVQEYLFAMRTGVERVTYMYIMDTDNCNYGLLNLDGSWRLSAYAVANMIDMLPDPLIVEAIAEGLDRRGKLTGEFAYKVEPEPGAEPIVVAFTTAKKLEMTIPWTEEFAVLTDMFGHSKVIKANSNKTITFEAGACMQYIRTIDQVPDIDSAVSAPATSPDTSMVSYAWEEGRYL